MERIFVELGFEIFIAAVFGIVARLLKQPLVIAYIITGFILGPSIFGFIEGREMVSLFSTIGIAFLLFIVGMELNTEKLAELGKKTIFLGIIQIVLTALGGYVLSRLLGFSDIVSIYIGIVLSFSSTVIVVNLLSEKKAITSLYGKMVVGILVLQDIAALFVLVFLGGVKSGEVLSWILFASILIKAVLLFLIAYLISILLIKKVFNYLAHSPELLFLASIAWCFAVAGGAFMLGFSIEMGAFIAGLTLASLPYSDEITLRLSPLRDFFLILFFITLGMQIDWSGISGFIFPLVALVLFVIIIKTLIILISMGAFGFTKRTSFYTAVSLSQVSEFSLIIAALGLSIGHLDKGIVSMIILITIITILTSTYFINFLGHIYNLIQKPLSLFEMNQVKEKKKKIPLLKDHIILFGYHRLGKQIFKSLEKISKKIIVVDIDPDVVYDLNCRGKYCVYGDAYDPLLLEKLNIGKAKMIVTTFPGKKSNAFLIKKVRAQNKRAKIIAMADHASDAIYLYKTGADYVILPHHLTGVYVASMLEDVGSKKKDLKLIKKSHLQFLKNYQGS
ncbi:MAG: cation:proton antiporter [Patescibacteria group bacterium]|nr:cation:proton antiporter [Patescibacteria group bacterium]